MAAVREDFPFFKTGIAYLDSANTSQRPRAVMQAMEEYFTLYNANIHRGAYAISELATERFEQARAKVAGFIHASPRDLIWTRGTTEAINLVAASWGRQHLGPGDLIVLTVMEHHSNLVPWQIVAAERGATIEYVDVDDSGELRQEQYRALLEREPKLVCFTQVSNTLGTINPVPEMTRLAHAAGAVVLVDGAQGAPHLGFDVEQAGVDFYALSGHKMLGPTGIGALWGRRELLAAMPPYMSGGDMIRSVTLGGTTYADPPQRFEAGTQAVAEAIGFGAAIDYLDRIGLDAVQAHERELLGYAMEALSELKGTVVYGPPAERRSGVVSFQVEGIHPHDLATILDRHQVCIRAGHNCTQPLMERLGVAATARASFYVYNQKNEIDRLIEGLEDAKRIFQ